MKNLLLKVKIKRMPNLKDYSFPTYASLGSAGMDLVAAIDANIVIKPLERKLVPTGIAIELPMGYEAQIRPRSGLALKNGISVPNSPGTIDSDYRGEICVILINLSAQDVLITPGMRVAQMVIAQYTQVTWDEVEELSSSERGEGGFGSTGTHKK